MHRSTYTKPDMMSGLEPEILAAHRGADAMLASSTGPVNGLSATSLEIQPPDAAPPPRRVKLTDSPLRLSERLLSELQKGAEAESDIVIIARKPPVPKPQSTKAWPIPGNGRAAVKGATGPNNRRYSDGRFSLKGAYRTQNGKPHAHKGINLPGAISEPVRVAAGGVVMLVTTQREKIWARDPKTGALLKNKAGKAYKVRGPKDAGWGNYIVVQHPDGYQTMYAHLQERPAIKVGTRVGRGDEIGRLGVSGNARGQGSHVHFEVWKPQGKARIQYDPTKWINGQLPGQ